MPEDVLKLLVQPRIGGEKGLKVSQEGVIYRGLGYGNRELLHLLGKQVWIRVDWRDLSSVTVYDQGDNPIAVAHANRNLPVLASQAELRAHEKAKARYAKILKEAPEARMRIAEDPVDALIRGRVETQRRSAASNPAPHHDPTPPSISPVRSDLEAALPALQRMRQAPLKKAVGDGTPHPPHAASNADILSAFMSDADESPALSAPSQVPNLLSLMGDGGQPISGR